MKTNLIHKTMLLVIAMAGGVSQAWADGNISVPQALGSYIVLGTATGTSNVSPEVTISNCQIDGELGDASNNKYYTIGSTGASTEMTISLSVTTAGDYAFGFKTGAKDLTAMLALSLNNGSTDVWTNTASVSNTGSWTPTEAHVYKISSLAVGTYTLKLKVNSTTGKYAGNYGNFYFHSMDQLAMPATTSSYLELSDGEFSNARDNSNNVVSYIYDGGYIDNLLVYNATDGYYSFNFTIEGFQNYDDSQVSITITDISSGTQELSQTVSVSKNANYVLPMAAQLTAGLKKVKIGFASAKAKADNNHYLYNLKQVYFPTYSYDALPLTGTATLNLNQSTATFTNCGYESSEGKDNIGNVMGSSPSADNYYVWNSNETAYYDVYVNIPWYNSETQLKMTVTDLATGAEEATGTSAAITSAAGNIHFALNNAITPGAKRIRFDFVSATTDAYLINAKNVSFYKRSLNENYDYTAVAANGVDVVLTRSIASNKWSTICLPFDIESSAIETIFGSGTSVAELSSGDVTTLNFTTTLTDSKMKANQPYAIKVASDFTTATISGVTIATATPTQSITNWNFVGTYNTNGSIPANSYFFSDNQLWQAEGTENTIKPFRAYFTYTGGSNSARELNFIIDEDGQTTTIGRIAADGTMTTMARGACYNLSGQRVVRPAKGLYIVNGKKVIIR